jgi:hypothetical protein
MFRAVILTLLLALTVGALALNRVTPGNAQTTASPVAGTPVFASEADLLREIVIERLRALVEADLSGADTLYAADFQNLTAAGVVQARDEYLGRIRSGEHDYLLLEPASAIAVRLYGEGAVVTYQSRVDLMSGGNRITGVGWHTELYEWRDGRWQLVWSQTTQVRE